MPCVLPSYTLISRDQRQRYHRLRDKAESDPSLPSIILDGMDQNKTNLPHLKRVEKSAANLWQCWTHLTGAIIHGKQAEAYFDLHQWPHDPNLTINILARVIEGHFSQVLQRGGKLPSTLYLQLDNCARENKNQHVLAFLALLVELCVFQEVNYSSLILSSLSQKWFSSIWLLKLGAGGGSFNVLVDVR